MYSLQQNKEVINQKFPTDPNKKFVINNYYGNVNNIQGQNGELNGNPTEENMDGSLLENAPVNQEDGELNGNPTEEEFEFESEMELPPIDIDPSDKKYYKYDKNYFYVDNEKYLQKRFDEIEPTKKYKINACIYKCVRNGPIPYLLYLLLFDRQTGKYILPNKMGGEAADPKESVEETGKKTTEQFNEFLFDIFPPGQTKPVDSKDEIESEGTADLYDESLFKGFFLEDSAMTMVYDATRINLPTFSNASTVYVWASPYEIFISKKYNNTEIDDSVRELFLRISDNEKDFHHLKNASDKTIVKTPYILFICAGSAGAGSPSLFSFFGKGSDQTNQTILFENMYKTSDKESPIFAIYPKINHPQLGNYTFFSSEQLDTSRDNTLLKRFAVFVDVDDLQPLYIEKGEEDKINHLYDMDQTESYSAVTFLDGENRQLWCVKSAEYFSEIVD